MLRSLQQVARQTVYRHGVLGVVPVRFLRINTKDLKPGNFIRLDTDGDLWEVATTRLAMKSRGSSSVHLELVHSTNGTKLSQRLSSGTKIEQIPWETRKFTFLYRDSSILHLMDPSTFEQSELPSEVSAGALPFLEDGCEVEVQIVDDTPLSLVLPKMATLTIASCDEAAQTGDKYASLSTGLKMLVPGFCKIGDKVLLSCADKRFVSVEAR